MPEPKPGLPRSVIILNVVMIILIVVICILTFSLAYSNAMGDTSSGSSSGDSVSSGGALLQSGSTTGSSSVSMTKRTTPPDEDTSEPETQSAPDEQTSGDTDTSSGSEDGSNEQQDNSYSAEFFADDLFIGDSITTGLGSYNKLDLKNVAAGVGYTPYKAYNDEIELYDGSSATAYDYAKNMQPKRLFIMLGSNGLLYETVMEGSYRTLVDMLREACPNSQMYCISVTPLTSDSSTGASTGITNDMVTTFNTFIKSLCEEYSIPYIDFYSQVADSDGYFMHEYAEADGMHFKGATYDFMLSYIQKSIEGDL